MIPVDELDEAQAVEELTRLADTLAAHDLAYHRDAAPTISDGEYDALKRRNDEIEARFPELIRENSPSMKVGAARAEQFSPVTHGAPMLSLDNAFSNEEAAEFDAKVRRFLKLGEANHRLYRRAQDRRAVGLAALRERRTDPGRHARRWPGR